MPKLRKAWPDVRIVVRADSGFCREPILKWCEDHNVDYLVGLAKNKRLTRAIRGELHQAKQQFEAIGEASRVFKDFRYRTRRSWSCERRGGRQGRASLEGSQSADSSSLRCRLIAWMRRRSTKIITVLVEKWKTASKNSSCICSPIAPARTRCDPINCGCCSRRMAYTLHLAPSRVWPGRYRDGQRSGGNHSHKAVEKSAHGSKSASAGFGSPSRNRTRINTCSSEFWRTSAASVPTRCWSESLRYNLTSSNGRAGSSYALSLTN